MRSSLRFLVHRSFHGSLGDGLSYTSIYRAFVTRTGPCWQTEKNRPPSARVFPRPAGIPSFCRLPVQETSQGLDACFVGVPIDVGSNNRVGSRFGPRQIRTESVMVRTYNKDTGASPYDSLNVADVGDVAMRMYDLPLAVQDIKNTFTKLINNGCKTLAMGGDHTITYPILQAYKEKYGPVGLVHVDAHTDTGSEMVGCPIAHGTPFYRAVEEGLLDNQRVVQIGLRGTGYSLDDMEWGQKQGFRCVPAQKCWHKSLVPLMVQVRRQMGEGPVYISFDIDALDPAFAPGTGTPEMAGLTIIQALEIIRGCRGLDVVGCDLVEVSPPYDKDGTTALTAAHLLFEMLCVLPGVDYKPVPEDPEPF